MEIGRLLLSIDQQIIILAIIIIQSIIITSILVLSIVPYRKGGMLFYFDFVAKMRTNKNFL